MPRLFFALLPSPGSRDALRALAMELARATRAHPVPAPDLHLTLCFLGCAPVEPALQVLAGLSATALASVGFGAMEYWSGARVLCVTAVPEHVNSMTALAADIQMALSGIGQASDPGTFIPHVTLARRPSPALLVPPWPRAMARALDVRFDTLALLESRNGVPSGQPRYAPVATRSVATLEK